MAGELFILILLLILFLKKEPAQRLAAPVVYIRYKNHYYLQ